MFYLFRRDERDETWRVLTIDRTEQTSLVVVDDRTCYTDGERHELLRRLHAGKAATGGLNFVAKCYGTISFVKFLGPYYMLLITRTKEVGVICGHAVYAVDKSDMITVPGPNVIHNVARSNDENRYKRPFCSVNIRRDFFFSYSYNIMHPLQKNIVDKNISWMSQHKTKFERNEFLTRGNLEQLKDPIWTVALVHGFFRQDKVLVSEKDFLLTIIARGSRHFVGPRFLKRGVNENALVANDVETEKIVFEDIQDEIRSNIPSVVQYRWSITLLWSQEAKFPIKPDIKIQSDMDYKATRLHFNDLVMRYGNPIIILNFVKVIENKPRESLLRVQYAKAIEHINNGLSDDKQLMVIHLDLKNYAWSCEVLPCLVLVGSASLAQTGFLHCQLTTTSLPDHTLRSFGSKKGSGAQYPNGTS